jgi:hypothetical protein
MLNDNSDFVRTPISLSILKSEKRKKEQSDEFTAASTRCGLS